MNIKMKTLKVIIYIAVSIFLLSCSLVERVNSVETSQLTISVNNSSATNSSRAIKPLSESFDIVLYEITCIGPRGVTFTDSFIPGNSFTNNFELGDWEFTINGYNGTSSSKKLVAAGVKNVTLSSSSANISVSIYPVGFGSLKLDLDWDVDASADTVRINGSERANNSPISEAIDVADMSNYSGYTLSSIEAGVYDLTITLESNGITLETVKEVLYVIDGTESYKSISLYGTESVNDLSVNDTTFSINKIYLENSNTKITKIQVNNGLLDIFQEDFSSISPTSPWIKGENFTVTEDIYNGHRAIIYTLTNNPNNISEVIFVFNSDNRGRVLIKDSSYFAEGLFYYSVGEPEDIYYFLLENSSSLIDFSSSNLMLGSYKIGHYFNSINMEAYGEIEVGGTPQSLPGESYRPYIPSKLHELIIDYSATASPRVYSLSSPLDPDFYIDYNFFSKYRGIAEYKINSKDRSNTYTGVVPFTFCSNSRTWDNYTPNYYLDWVNYRDDIFRRTFRLTDSNDSKLHYKMDFEFISNSQGYCLSVQGFDANDPKVTYFGFIDILGKVDNHYLFKGKILDNYYEEYGNDYLHLSTSDVDNKLNTTEEMENVYFKIPEIFDGSETIKFYNGTTVLDPTSTASNELKVVIEEYEEVFYKALNTINPSLGTVVSAISENDTGAIVNDLRVNIYQLSNYFYEGTQYYGFGYLTDVVDDTMSTPNNLLVSLDVNDHGEGVNYIDPIYQGMWKFLYYGDTGKGVFSYFETADVSVPKSVSGIFHSQSSTSTIETKEHYAVDETWSLNEYNFIFKSDGTIQIETRQAPTPVTLTGTYNIFETNHTDIDSTTGVKIINYDVNGDIAGDTVFEDNHWFIFKDANIYAIENIIDYLEYGVLPTSIDNNAV